MNRRPIGRLVLIAGVLILGGASALRLPLAFLPEWSLPELWVDLELPRGSDLDQVARRWVLPLESSIRAAGDVRGTGGEIGAAGAGLRVRFAAGTDVARKAARLESELAGLRRRLPAGARLSVWPAGQGAGDRSAIVWLGGDPGMAGGPVAEPRLVEALRDLPEVRAVDVAGEGRREIRIRTRPAAGVAAAILSGAVDRGLRAARLGHLTTGGHRLPMVVAGRRGLPFADLPIRRGEALVPLRALADVERVDEEPPWLARLDGKPGVVLLVSRELTASPLALERSLRRTFAAFADPPGRGGARQERARLLIDEAAPLKRLLGRLLLGGLAATLVAAALAGWMFGARAAGWQALALPLALAAACSAFLLLELPLDVTTLPALAAGLGCALLFIVFRNGGEPAVPAATIAVSASTLPIAVALAGGALAPMLQTPVRAFAAGVVAGVAVLCLLPALFAGSAGILPASRRSPQDCASSRRDACAPSRAPGQSTRTAAPARWALRNPWTVLLGAAVAGYLLFVLSGRALAPRPGNLAPAIGDLAVYLRFAEGATAGQAADQVAAVEAHLDAMDEVEGHWSIFDRWRGRVVASVRRRDRPLRRLGPIARRLQAQLASVGASARVEPLGSGGGASEPVLTESLEERPETDDDSTFYRFILRHTDARALQLAHGLVMERLAKLEKAVWYRHIHADWARPATRVELAPRPGVSAEAAAVAARAVALGTTLPAARPLALAPDLRLRVMDQRSPSARDQVAQVAELLGLQPGLDATAPPLAPSALLAAREVVAPPTVRRQSGRFVLPMTVTVSGSIKAERKLRRQKIDRALAVLRLPAGTALERPELNPAIWSRERLRLLAIAGALPALFFAVAAVRLSSVGAGLAALVPPALGVAAASPFVQAARGHLDELTLLLLAAALAGTLPVAIEAAAASGKRVAGAYRWLARRAPGFAVAVPALLALLVVPGIGLDNDRHPWVLPLRAAGVAAAASCLASFLVLPVLLRTARRLGRPLPARPVAWEEGARAARAPAPGRRDLSLVARNLTKVYGDGFRALHAASFRLEPGIVGLLGPNGAGKTTLLRLLCGLLEPSRGQVRFNGVPLSPANLADYRRLVGYLPQGFNAYEDFTGAEFLDYWALERGLADRTERRREIERVLAQVGLEDAAGRKVRDFSGGMRRRAGIARALLGSPPIVIVDEPTTGLDVESRNALRETLLAVAGERIILFSTHIASDVAAAASRILILDRGRLAFDGPALDLIAAARGQVFEARIEDHDLADFCHRFRVTTRVRSLDGLKVRAIAYGGAEPAGEVVEPNLEEAYLARIGAPGERDPRRGRSGSLLDLAAWDSRKHRPVHTGGG